MEEEKTLQPIEGEALQPVNDYICIKEIETDSIAHLIPDSQKQDGQIGIVVSISKEHDYNPALFLKINLEPGDMVIFRKHAGTKYKDYRFINYQYDVIAKQSKS